MVHWLKNEKRRFQAYVANRVEEIRENSKPEEWNHMPGSLTPAEDISRDLTPSELNQRWLQGPEFLWWPESHWSNAVLTNVPDEELELKHESHVLPVTQSLQYSSLRLTVPPPDVLVTLLTSSSVWNTLIVQIAWLVRFIQFLGSLETVRKGRLTPGDYDAATTAIVRIVQH